MLPRMRGRALGAPGRAEWGVRGLFQLPYLQDNPPGRRRERPRGPTPPSFPPSGSCRPVPVKVKPEHLSPDSSLVPKQGVADQDHHDPEHPDAPGGAGPTPSLGPWCHRACSRRSGHWLEAMEGLRRGEIVLRLGRTMAPVPRCTVVLASGAAVVHRLRAIEGHPLTLGHLPELDPGAAAVAILEIGAVAVASNAGTKAESGSHGFLA